MAMRNPRPLMALIVLAMGTMACAEQASVGGSDPFGSITWQLTAGSVDGNTLIPIGGSPVTLRVDGEQVGGTSACNSYGGPLSMGEGTVTIGPAIHMTEMACLAEGVMELEAAYLGAIARVTSAVREATDLVLRGDAVELRFSARPEEPPAALVGTAWTLESIVAGDVVATPVAAASLLIDETGHVSGSTGCNRINGSYEATAGFSPLATTKMACKDEIMAQETTVLEILGSRPTLTIDGSLLTIADLEGRALLYRAG
ncbi:MAG: hypothetical protein A2Z12_04380 [Actinobacteria bacterium RBG_16_68_21]|nr:MAG: hypothetical protein A2Z12_04380 [Actinobacteria bacterium RBG_16_68_21]